MKLFIVGVTFEQLHCDILAKTLRCFFCVTLPLRFADQQFSCQRGNSSKVKYLWTKQLHSDVLVDKAALKMASKAPPTRALADLGQMRIEQAAIWKSQPDFRNREKDTRTLKS